MSAVHKRAAHAPDIFRAAFDYINGCFLLLKGRSSGGTLEAADKSAPFPKKQENLLDIYRRVETQFAENPIRRMTLFHCSRGVLFPRMMQSIRIVWDGCRGYLE
jgi:hypothetical protein